MENCEICGNSIDFIKKKSTICKCCAKKESDRKHYQKNKEKILSRIKEYTKDNSESIRQYKKEYYIKNKEKIITKNKSNYFKNHEKNLDTKRKAYYRNKEENLEKSRQWRVTNREFYLESQKLYRKRNKHRINKYSQDRKSRKLQAIPGWLTEEQNLEILNIYKTARKMSEETGVQHHVDHIIPLVNKFVCGLHIPENLQIITAEENLQKSNSFDIECDIVRHS